MSIYSLLDTYESDFKSAESVLDDMYKNIFEKKLQYIHNLSDTLKDKYEPCSDEVLEQILIDVPIKLFDAAECLSDLQLRLQIVKLSLKNKKIRIKRSTMDDYSQKLNQSDLSDKITEMTYEDEILIMIYSRLIERVQSEISYTKELIMGAKKVWDRRRQTEMSMPVDPIDDKLPDYETINNHRYIHG